MRFFTMEQDKMLPDMIELRDFDIRGPRHVFQKKDAGMIHASTTLYLSEKAGRRRRILSRVLCRLCQIW